MDTIKLLAIGQLNLGLVILITSLPLIFRKVPMNRSFGIRTRAAFASDERWYEINARGGRHLAIWSPLMIAAGVAGFFISPAHFAFYALGCLVATLLAIGVPLVVISRCGPRS